MTIIEAELTRTPDDLDPNMPVDIVVSHPSPGIMKIEVVDTWGGRLVLEADYDKLGYAIMEPATEIIEELASRNPVAGLGGRCYYCGAWPSSVRALLTEEHRESCLWRRARSL